MLNDNYRFYNPVCLFRIFFLSLSLVVNLLYDFFFTLVCLILFQIDLYTFGKKNEGFIKIE